MALNPQPITEKKSFVEEFDWKQIDQLHAATLQFSGNCLEYKKLCVGLITAVPTVIISITHRLDASLFVAILLIAVSFWIIDAQAYYYQGTLRARMKVLATEIQRERCEEKTPEGVGMPVQEQTEQQRRFKSYVNVSQLPYLMLCVLDLSLWFCYSRGFISV